MCWTFNNAQALVINDMVSSMTILHLHLKVLLHLLSVPTVWRKDGVHWLLAGPASLSLWILLLLLLLCRHQHHHHHWRCWERTGALTLPSERTDWTLCSGRECELVYAWCNHALWANIFNLISFRSQAKRCILPGISVMYARPSFQPRQ